MSTSKQTVQTHCERPRINGQAPQDEESSLPPHRAFVVQLREHVNVERGEWVGRIEHVTSGQATRFHSLDELAAFVVRILAVQLKMLSGIDT